LEFSEIIGYIGALAIGVVLGLVGGGGSILTVPVLVYLLGLNPIISTAYSLFIVGVTALIGALKNIRKGLVDFRTAFVFATPALISVYITRRFIIPAIPENLFSVGGVMVTRDVAVMVFFAILMLAASYSMIKSKDTGSDEFAQNKSFNYPLIILEGIAVGLATGIVGAGGGFLIIPALVLLAGLPMKKAVATSLLIIAIKSLIGFVGDVQNLSIDWPFLLSFTAISVLGIFIGIWAAHYISGTQLKKGFGWFVLLMAVIILIQELAFS
jgi:uncharacterized membrane protein YfcA